MIRSRPDDRRRMQEQVQVLQKRYTVLCKSNASPFRRFSCPYKNNPI